MKKIILIILICINCTCILIGCGKNTEDVFKEFDEKNEVALQDYNALSDKNKIVVDNMIKNEIENIYNENGDYTGIQTAIDKYKGIENLEEYLQESKDKTYFRMIYNDAKEIINQYKSIEDMTYYDLRKVLDNYELIEPESEYYKEISSQMNDLKYQYREKYKKEAGFYPMDEDVKLSEPTIGMTQDDVIKNTTWGSPKDINKTTTKYGVSEQWIYNNYKYLYFDDGILTTIQE